MTHAAESSFGAYVTAWFVERYGPGAVDEQPHLEPTGNIPDLVVDADWAVLYVEIENDASSIRTGVGQAQEYAGHDPVAGVPLVVVPAGHGDEAELQRLRRRSVATVREFDADAREFVR